MKNSAKLAAAVGMCLLAMAASSKAATLDFIGYIDGLVPAGVGEQAVLADFTDANYLAGYTIAAHGSTVAAVGSPVPAGFDNYDTTAWAYLDGKDSSGSAGVGVCKVLSGTQCNPSSDDNVTGPSSGGGATEVLSMSFTNAAVDTAFSVNDIQLRNEGHTTVFGAGKSINISKDGVTWTTYAISVAGLIVGIPATGIGLLAGQFLHFQHVDQQFYLASLNIFGNPGRTDIVPLPAALPLLLGGLAGLGFLGRMRRRRQANGGVSA